MQPLNPQSLIVCAHAFVGCGDIRRHPAIHGRDWDLAFVHHVGWHSQRLRGGDLSAWPFSRELTHDKLASVAQGQGLVVNRPREGDIVLFWSKSRQAHVRAGIVVELAVESRNRDKQPVYRCVTVGVAPAPAIPLVNGEPPRHQTHLSWQVRELETAICPAQGDLLIRWTQGDARQAFVDARDNVAAPNRAAWEIEEQLGLDRCA